MRRPVFQRGRKFFGGSGFETMLQRALPNRQPLNVLALSQHGFVHLFQVVLKMHDRFLSRDQLLPKFVCGHER